jgi:hypothetical protein
MTSMFMGLSLASRARKDLCAGPGHMPLRAVITCINMNRPAQDRRGLSEALAFRSGHPAIAR